MDASWDSWKSGFRCRNVGSIWSLSARWISDWITLAFSFVSTSWSAYRITRNASTSAPSPHSLIQPQCTSCVSHHEECFYICPRPSQFDTAPVHILRIASRGMPLHLPPPLTVWYSPSAHLAYRITRNASTSAPSPHSLIQPQCTSCVSHHEECLYICPLPSQFDTAPVHILRIASRGMPLHLPPPLTVWYSPSAHLAYRITRNASTSAPSPHSLIQPQCTSCVSHHEECLYICPRPSQFDTAPVHILRIASRGMPLHLPPPLTVWYSPSAHLAYRITRNASTSAPAPHSLIQPQCTSCVSHHEECLYICPLPSQFDTAPVHILRIASRGMPLHLPPPLTVWYSPSAHLAYRITRNASTSAPAPHSLIQPQCTILPIASRGMPLHLPPPLTVWYSPSAHLAYRITRNASTSAPSPHSLIQPQCTSCVSHHEECLYICPRPSQFDTAPVHILRIASRGMPLHLPPPLTVWYSPSAHLAYRITRNASTSAPAPHSLIQPQCTSCVSHHEECFYIWVIPCQINQFFAKFARPPSDFDEIWHTCR